MAMFQGGPGTVLGMVLTTANAVLTAIGVSIMWIYMNDLTMFSSYRCLIFAMHIGVFWSIARVLFDVMIMVKGLQVIWKTQFIWIFDLVMPLLSLAGAASSLAVVDGIGRSTAMCREHPPACWVIRICASLALVSSAINYFNFAVRFILWARMGR